jgi:hypothetical protein
LERALAENIKKIHEIEAEIEKTEAARAAELQRGEAARQEAASARQRVHRAAASAEQLLKEEEEVPQVADLLPLDEEGKDMVAKYEELLRQEADRQEAAPARERHGGSKNIFNRSRKNKSRKFRKKRKYHTRKLKKS